MRNLRHPNTRRRAGFTFVEVMIAIVIMSFLFLGSVALFTTATQTTARVNADAASSGTAANVMHQVMDNVREASYFALPDDSGSTSGTNSSHFVYPTGKGWSSFTTTANGSTIDTGIMFVGPGTLSDTVYSNTGNSLGITAYNRDPTVGTAFSSTLNYIYRADQDGTPDPSAGQYVAWATANSTGGSFTVARTIKISDVPAASAATNAVQFVRTTDSSGNPQKYSMEMKIVSTYYSPINNMQTSEKTNGTRVSQMTGKCVMMRDHELGATYEPSSGSGTSSSGQWTPD